MAAAVVRASQQLVRLAAPRSRRRRSSRWEWNAADEVEDDVGIGTKKATTSMIAAVECAHGMAHSRDRSRARPVAP